MVVRYNQRRVDCTQEPQTVVKSGVKIVTAIARRRKVAVQQQHQTMVRYTLMLLQAAAVAAVAAAFVNPPTLALKSRQTKAANSVFKLRMTGGTTVGMLIC